MQNFHSQPDALAALKTRLEALGRAGGRSSRRRVRAGSDDAFAPLATGVLHDLYAAAPADAVAVNAFGLGMALRTAAGRPFVWGLHEMGLSPRDLLLVRTRDVQTLWQWAKKPCAVLPWALCC